jgi:hypothetical protein
MQAEHLAMDLLLVQDTQVPSKTAFKAEALAQLPMVEMQQATRSQVLVVLVVTFQHGWVKRRRQLTKVAVAVVLLFTLPTGATQHQALLLAV